MPRHRRLLILVQRHSRKHVLCLRGLLFQPRASRCALSFSRHANSACKVHVLTNVNMCVLTTFFKGTLELGGQKCVGWPECLCLLFLMHVQEWEAQAPQRAALEQDVSRLEEEHDEAKRNLDDTLSTSVPHKRLS